MESNSEGLDKCDRCGELVTTKNTEHSDFNERGELATEGCSFYFKCEHCGFEVAWYEPNYAKEMNTDFRSEAVADALKGYEIKGKK